MITFIFILFSIILLGLILFLMSTYFKDKNLDLSSQEKMNKESPYHQFASILILIFMIGGIIYINSQPDKEEKKDTYVENISDVDIDSIIAETNKPKSKADIENLFSAWDGSLPSFKDYIKENLQNPDSFEHVETKFRDDGDGLTVIMKYRGENGFGAIRTQTAIAKVDYDGNILNLISNE